ncbi:hypothetical protein B0H13DRAFT_377807 [Mycena leptocephala]|nr:hypothetical protein B0H13DRAFT_377807 [Mycena leptocephala]
MQLLTLKTREAYQNTPSPSCQEFAGLCMKDAVILMFIVILVVGLFLLTLGLNIRASWRRRREEQAASDNNPPPYSSLGFPPSPSHDMSLSKSETQSPSLDPYHVVAPSFDNSVLLNDEYFSHIPYPDPTLAPNQQRMSGLPSGAGSGVGLGFGNTMQAGPSTPAASIPELAPLPPAYARDPRRGAAEDPSH